VRGIVGTALKNWQQTAPASPRQASRHYSQNIGHDFSTQSLRTG
jgi:hypothetical protein